MGRKIKRKEENTQRKDSKYNSNEEKYFYTNEEKIRNQFDKFKCKTKNQQLLLQAIEEFPVTFAIGPAATGKSYVCSYSSLKHYFDGKVKKIIVTRPIVEVGESLGYLPGEINNKFSPFAKPIYDIFENLLSKGHLKNLIANESISVIPLAYMRGITFTDCFVICDEMQNAKYNQIKMLLSRIGFGSKVVLTGDLSQSDLKNEDQCLGKIINKINKIEELKIIQFDASDNQRHPIVEKISKILV